MNSYRIYRREVLLAGVSALALAVVLPEAQAADLPRPPLYAKAPTLVEPPWTWWVEGAAFWTGGPRVPLLDPLTTIKPGVGWEGAIGVDYRFDPVWHLSADFRYGAARKKNQPWVGTVTGVPTIGGTITAFGGGGLATDTERHWVADFMVGREFGLGGGKAQVKVGLRIAEISANTTGAAFFGGPSGLGPLTSAVITERSKFVGFGPRVAIEGNHPLHASWTFEYAAGMAGLFGDSKFNFNLVGVPTPTLVAPISSRQNLAIFNLDASVGVSYWMSATSKLTAGYRFDGYWNALRTFGTGGAFGAVVDDNRFFHGPFLRLTGKF